MRWESSWDQFVVTGSHRLPPGSTSVGVPTGLGDVGRLDSTMIGAVANFRPCQLCDGEKPGHDIDFAFRTTLETIWGKFIDGGFRHDSAWHCYGPYLTLQLAHAFLLIGDVDRMDRLLAWKRETPARWWSMGDIAHGWACAELMMLVRDILFFEAAEDRDPHICIAPGVTPHWLEGGASAWPMPRRSLGGLCLPSGP